MAHLARDPWPIVGIRLSLGLRIMRLRNMARRALAPDRPTGPAANDSPQANKGLTISPPNSDHSLEGYDAIISFDPADQIWTHEASTCPFALIGYFHDAIAFRRVGILADQAGDLRHAVGAMARRADAVVCPSHASLKDLEDLFPQSKGKGLVVHLCGTPPTAPKVSPRTDGGPVVVLAFSNATGSTSLQALLRAIPAIRERLASRDLKLILCARGQTRRRFEILQNRVGRNVEITWTEAAPETFFGLASVAFSHSLIEGFPSSMLAAMAAGLPVVANRLSSAPEVGGEHALYCDPFEPSAIADAILMAADIDTPGRLERLQAAAQWASSYTEAETGAAIAKAIECGLAAKSGLIPLDPEL